MRVLVQDLRYALRQVRKNPGSTATAVLMIALGIGATTAVFSVVYGVLLRPLPYADSSQIMAVFEVSPKGAWNRLADPNFDDFRDQNRSFASIAKYNVYPASVSGGSQPSLSMVGHVSADFFEVFRVEPILGRGLNVADTVKGATPVAIVSYGYWREYLRSSPDLSQLHLKIGDAIFSVVGVMPSGFQFPREAAIWTPADSPGNPSRSSHNFNAVARLKDGVTTAQANADISAIARRIYDNSSERNDFFLKDATVVPLQESITGESRPALLVLLAAVAFLLVVACANVANLRLAQASVRERELAIRTALGAARGRLIRQFITEAFVLSFVGGGLGILLAFFGVNALVALAPASLPRLNEISVNPQVLAVAFLVCSLVAVGLGVFTAVSATSRDSREALFGGGRAPAGLHSHGVGRGIVAAQTAVTLILVIGAGLLGRSLLKVLDVNPGFHVDKITTMHVSLPWVRWEDQRAKSPGEVMFFRNLIDRLQQIPGVRKVGAATGLPLNGGFPNGEFLEMRLDEQPRTPATLPALGRLFDSLFRDKQRSGTADFCAATPGYFETLGIPLVKGRMFDERDGLESPHVALVSESLARERWPGQDPVGHTIEFGNMDGDLRLLTIIGIVGDVRGYGLDIPPQPTVYVDLLQRPRNDVTMTMLSETGTGVITSAAREILRQLNPEVPVEFTTFSHIYWDSLASRRFTVVLVGLFGMIALLLASAGLFGVMAYSVSKRTHEIGVRVALGAGSRNILAMIIGQGLRTVLVGVVVGCASSFLIIRPISSLLFGVSVADAPTYAVVILLLIGIALLACYVPASRAAKVDPVVALRYE